MAYLLQSIVDEEDVYDEDWNWIGTQIPQIWGQTIGTEVHPVLGGEQVYEVTDRKDERIYSNTDENGQHSYTDGVFARCGAQAPAAVVQPGLTLSYPTLSFEDEIIYNVYFSVKDMTSVVEMGLMILPKMDQTATIDDAVATVPGYVTNGVAYLYSTAGGYNAKAYFASIKNNVIASQPTAGVAIPQNHGRSPRGVAPRDDIRYLWL